MRIQNNVTAVNSHRQLSGNQLATSKTMEKLSSGYRVNRAADDAAGLAISEKMRTQIRGMSQANRNVQDGISLMQVADGAMQLAHGIVQRMRELAAQSANGTNDDPLDREALNLEYQQLLYELDQIADTTNFNGVYPLKGTGMDIPFRATVGVSPFLKPEVYLNLPGTYNGPSLQGVTMPDTTIATAIDFSTWSISEIDNTFSTDNSTASISGTYTVPAGSSVLLSGANIASGTVINVPTGTKLVISGDVSGITINSEGNVRIDGNVTGSTVSGTGNITINGNANVTNNTSGTGGVRVIGASRQITNNGTGNLVVAGASAQIENNTGNILITANNSTVVRNSGSMHLTGNISNIGINDGYIKATGSTAGTITVTTNNRQVDLATGNATARLVIGTNNGDARMNGTSSRINTINNGQVYISGNGTFIAENSRHLTLEGNQLNIVTNNLTGRVNIPNTNTVNVTNNYGEMRIDGFDSTVTTIDTNTGKLTVTPRAGQNGGTVSLSTNSGEALLQVNTATVTTNNGQLRMTGTAATSVLTLTNNNKSAYIVNTASTAVPSVILTNNNENNTGAQVRIDANNARIGTNYAKGELDLRGNNGDITTNRGIIQATGTGTRLSINASTGSIRFASDTNAQVLTNNGGRIDVAGDSRLMKLTLNQATGEVYVEAGGQIIDTAGDNEGKIHADTGATVSMRSNLAGATIINKGTTTLDGNNAGYIEAGVWNGDAGTPPQGGPGGLTIQGNNTGTIRNFTAALNIFGGNTGLIENYGRTIQIPSPIGDLRHHARLLDTQGISKHIEDSQTITFWANGVERTETGSYQPTAEGNYELAFEFDIGGKIIFDAFNIPRITGVQFDIQNRESVHMGTGTSGFQLKFLIYDGFYIQSGANEGDATELTFRSLNANQLGRQPDAVSLGTSHIKDMENASRALTITLAAINDISLYRAEIGAQYNRLEFTYDNLGISTENLQAAESRIRDADMAKKMTIFTKNNILNQSSTAMLAQANALPQGVLQLLG